MIKGLVQLLPVNKDYTTTKHNLCRFISSVKKHPKSTLYISGERAVDTYVVVNPYLTFDQVFADIDVLEENVKRRGLKMDVARMKDSWLFYKDWNNKKIKLQENLDDLGKQINSLEMDNCENKNTRIEILQRHRILMKEELQQVKRNVWSLEDNVITELFLIPNRLHPESPETEVEMFSFKDENIIEGVDHLVQGKELNYIEYINGLTCFIQNKAALFELAVPEMFIDIFCNKHFVRFSNPDFSRSVLAEGVGLPPCDSSEIFLLEQTEGHNEKLHLCGGASLFPFCGFHAKHTVAKRSLPLRYITTGRRYSPLLNKLFGLYSVQQSTCVQIFVATSSEEEVYFEFETCVKEACEIFRTLGLNFKVIKQTPSSYKNWESLRASIAVFAPHLKEFVEIGSVSLVDDYVSKRLRMCYTDKTDEMFLRVVTGTLVNTQTLLALCLERSGEHLFIPGLIRNYMLD